MDNGMLLVNFGALSQASLDIQKAIDELHSQLGQLERDSRRLVDSWSGAAQAAYAERQRKWTTASDDLAVILRNIKVAVDDSAADYQDTERKAQQRSSERSQRPGQPHSGCSRPPRSATSGHQPIAVRDD